MSEITLDHHLYSFGEGDVEALLEDYREDDKMLVQTVAFILHKKQ